MNLDLAKGKLGFGCMRLPMSDGKVDTKEFCKMIDLFLESGFNYFDTAMVYLNGQSETALRECLVKRYPRDQFVFANKLSTYLFTKEEEIVPLFNRQLEACGLDYFDYYLMHGQNLRFFEKYKKCHAYEIAFELKKQGKIRHVGISFHDTPEVLDKILTEYPQIEVVLLQLNYLDFENPAVQARKCYEVCVKYNKPVLVMEPIKGGMLANLPPQCAQLLNDLHGGSQASYALRFAAGLDNVAMVLSGMSDFEQMVDNLNTMKDFKPLDEAELNAIGKVCNEFKSMNFIACTACRYCVDGCPKKIQIPNLFSCLNSKKIRNDFNSSFYYHNVYTFNNGKASDCIKCGKCEQACPQHLPIRTLLQEVAKEFEHD